MKLRKKICMALQLVCFIMLSGMNDEEQQPNGPKHVIFDLGYFVRPNIMAAGKKLGAANMFLAGLAGKINEEEATKELFTVLYDVQAPPAAPAPHEEHKDHGHGQHGQQELLYWHRNIVPPAMIAWFKNMMQSKEVLQAAHGVINQRYSRITRGRMQAASTLVFDPEQCADILETRPEIFKVVQRLQGEGHTVHVLGNWSSDIKTSIQHRFHEDFSKINGSIAVSGDFGAIKCLGNTTIYDKFFATYLPDVAADSIVLVEQSESKETWQKSLPIQTPRVPVVVAHPDNVGVLKARLMRAGLLTAPNAQTY